MVGIPANNENLGMVCSCFTNTKYYTIYFKFQYTKLTIQGLSLVYQYFSYSPGSNHFHQNATVRLVLAPPITPGCQMPGDLGTPMAFGQLGAYRHGET